MKLFRKVTKFIKTNHILAVLGFLVLLVAITQFSARKLNVTDNMHVSLSPSPLAPSVVPSDANTGTQYSPVQSNNVNGNDKAVVNTVSPNDLLPKTTDTSLQGAGGDLTNVNMLKSGHHIGINTVGSSNRNSNLQLRADPAIPKSNTPVCPWNNSTIEPDTIGLKTC